MVQIKIGHISLYHIAFVYPILYACSVFCERYHGSFESSVASGPPLFTNAVVLVSALKSKLDSLNKLIVLVLDELH